MKKVIFLMCSVMCFAAAAVASDSAFVCGDNSYTVYLENMNSQPVAVLYKGTPGGSSFTQLSSANCTTSDDGRVTRWSCTEAPNLNSMGYYIEITSGGFPSVGNVSSTSAHVVSQGTVIADQLPCYFEPSPSPAAP